MAGVRKTKPGVDRTPSWDALYEVAAGQAGLFTTEQAAEAGFSPQLLQRHLGSGNLTRPHRAIYRIARFPADDNEDLVVAWLWSKRKGVLSHETALLLHRLSDALPSRIHLTVPPDAGATNPPERVRLYRDEVSADEQMWMGPVPVTTPARTIRDLATVQGDPDILAHAIDDAIARQLARPVDLAEGIEFLRLSRVGEPVRPDVKPGLSYLLTLAGHPRSAVPPDWRIQASDAARGVGADLRWSRYFRESNLMSLDLVFGTRPSEDAVRASISATMGWQ